MGNLKSHDVEAQLHPFFDTCCPNIDQMCWTTTSVIRAEMAALRRCTFHPPTSTRSIVATARLFAEPSPSIRSRADRTDHAPRPRRRAQNSSARPWRDLRGLPARRESQNLMLKIHGTSVTWTDIRGLLRWKGKEGPVPTDYALRRDRQTSTTQIQMRFASPEAGEEVRWVLRTRSLNGSPIGIHALAHGATLIGKYEPLHASPQSGPGRAVSIEGLPYMCNETYLRRAFAGYDLVDNAEYQFHLVKKALNRSVWLLRAKSEDEAQRIVRTVNATYYKHDAFGTDYPLKAEVFY